MAAAHGWGVGVDGVCAGVFLFLLLTSYSLRKLSIKIQAKTIVCHLRTTDFLNAI